MKPEKEFKEYIMNLIRRASADALHSGIEREIEREIEKFKKKICSN